MHTWWDLGENSGLRGSDLGLWRITCPFCFEKGNFKLAFHAEKKKPNGSKRLNFDTLECGNCKGYVMVLWSASGFSLGPSGGIHDFRVLPYPLTYDSFPEHWPEQVGRFWLQAKRNLVDENFDAAVVMARSALQIALRDNKAEGKTLKQEIEDLAAKGFLPPIMKEWSDKVRELGNVGAHPTPGAPAPNQEDARDIVGFLDFLLECLYTLPHSIKQYRERNDQ
ncbi:MAG: DUF4145 domain-containing protein [Desulfobacterales bacterium]|nr:DUF4145 domain-containing protein [Desulfobacterales bacterium]